MPTDAHCIQMVQSGIAEKLLKVLSSHNSGEGDIRLQHALLSALRNLSIARENKPVLISQVSSLSFECVVSERRFSLWGCRKIQLFVVGKEEW